MRKTAIYYRIPTNMKWACYQEQEKAEAFAARHNDLKIVTTYSDIGFGISKFEKSIFQIILEGAAQGRFQVLIARAPCVLGADVSEILQFYQQLKEYGVQLLFYNGERYNMDYWLFHYQEMKKALAS